MQLASWGSVIPMALLIAAALYLPGAAVTWAAGKRRILDIAALSPLVALAIAGMGGIVAAKIHLSWGWAFYLVSAALVAVLTWLIRFGWHKRDAARGWETQSTGTSDSQDDDGTRNRTLAVVLVSLALVVAAATVIVRLAHAVPSPDQITQNYDTVFHDNVVARIVKTGQASSLSALPPVRYIYPIAFQQFAALGVMATGMSVPAAVTCTWLIFGAVVWPISMLFLVRSICGRDIISDVLAPTLSVAVAGAPFLLLDWGTLYSMYAGQMILPVLIGLTWTWCMTGWKQGHRTLIGGLAWIVVAGLAVSLSHFRVVMTFILLVVPVAIVWIFKAGRQLKAKKGPRVFWAIAGTFIAAVVMVVAVGVVIFMNMYLGGGTGTRPISDHLNGAPAQPTENIPSAILRFLTDQPINSSNQRLPINWFVVVLLAIGIVASVVLVGARKRGAWLLVAAFVLLGFVFISCAGTHADWAKVVTALWYKDQRRLFAAWPIVAVPIICLGFSELVKWGRTRAGERAVTSVGEGTQSAQRETAAGNETQPVPPTRRVTAVVSVAALALGIVVNVINPQMDAMMAAVSHTYSFASNGKATPMLSQDEYLLLKRMKTTIPADAVVVSDPWNGSAFMLAISERTPFYAHLATIWDADHKYVAAHLSEIATNSTVCTVLKRNNIEWYVDMGKPFAKNDPNQKMFRSLKVVPGAMTLVDSQGAAKLYRITACK